MTKSTCAPPARWGALLVRAARADDAADLAPRLRAADAAEAQAASGASALEALETGLALSDRAFAVVDATGRAVGLFGRARFPDRPWIAAPWLMGAPELTEAPKTFLAGARAWAAPIEDGVDLLMNVVDARNAVHIRWIRWMGFHLVRRIERYGPEGRPFIEFAKLGSFRKTSQIGGETSHV